MAFFVGFFVVVFFFEMGNPSMSYSYSYICLLAAIHVP